MSNLNKKYVLAVSGGPDSMAMLNMYRKKAYAVCTINYKKRENSDYDVSLVKEFCKQHKIKFYLYEVEKEIYKENESENFQSLARKIRYDFFVEICKKENKNHLMIAHNLNDWLETAYMQINKKSKALYYGIKPKTKYEDIYIYRPLLRYKKKTLQRYCDQKNIKYAIDYTNDMDIYERNRVRKIINNWTNDEILEFKKKVNKYNKQHKHLDKKVTKIFKLWSDNKFDLSIFNKNKKLDYYLIYNFLKLINEHNNNSNKINSIIDFINNTNNKNKKYRLEQNKFLILENNKLGVMYGK